MRFDRVVGTFCRLVMFPYVSGCSVAAEEDSSGTAAAASSSAGGSGGASGGDEWKDEVRFLHVCCTFCD